MTVSVIIPSYNGLGFLRNCLGSLTGPGRKPDQIIVVDNGSKDGSPRAVQREFPGVDLVALEENTGFTGANNAGIRASTGDLIVLLNNDCVVEENWLSGLIRRMEDPSIGAAACSLRSIHDLSVMDSAGGEIDWMCFSRDTGKGEPASLHAREKDLAYPCGGGVMIRRSALPDPSRLFWSELFAFNEDMDLGFELNRRGWRVVYEPSAMVRHVHSATSGRGSPFVEYHCARNRLLVMRKHFDEAVFKELTPILRRWQHLWVAVSLARGRLARAKAVLKGTRDGFNMEVRPFPAPISAGEILMKFATGKPGAGRVKSAMYDGAERIVRRTCDERGSTSVHG